MVSVSSELAATAPSSTTPRMQGPDRLEALIIGAGFAGVCLAIKLLERGVTNFRIVEKAGDIGGTWHHNRYPGAACDVPSHLYCYSFAPNPDWSRHYARQAEIKSYIKKCAKDYGLMPYITLCREVISLDFNEAGGYWTTAFSDGATLKSRFVFNATGGLHQPLIPAFIGEADFKGPKMHSAQWDDTIDLRNKRIAIIGSAASAIQITPPLSEIAAELSIFQRTPNFILPRRDRPFRKWQQRLFRYIPVLARLYRISIFLRLEYLIYPLVKNKSRLRHHMQNMAARWMKEEIKDKSLYQTLTPDYAIGCKRILISDDYYNALNADNVALITDAIDRFGNGYIELSSGRKIAADVIIYATGFDLTGHMNHLSVTGRNNIRLNDLWSEREEAYMGACVAGFPNYFFTTGPNTGVGTTSVVFMIEQQVHFLMQLIDHANEQDIIEVRQDAQDAYNRQIQTDLQKTVWASGCKSWYRKENGIISTLYPYDARSYKRQMHQPVYEDFLFETRGISALQRSDNPVEN